MAFTGRARVPLADRGLSPLHRGACIGPRIGENRRNKGRTGNDQP